MIVVIVVEFATVKSVILPAVVNVANLGAAVIDKVLITPSTFRVVKAVDVAFTVTARVPVAVEEPVTSAAFNAGKSSSDLKMWFEQNC